MALFSFIHSLNTTFGTSIFEPVAETLASLEFPFAQKQFVVGDEISEQAQNEIQHIMNELTIGGNPDKINEIERIRKVCIKGKINKLKTVKVDLFVKGNDESIHLFDLKTAKPNISNFKDFKRTLLEWVAIYLFKHPDAKVNSYIAIPYNPYEPKPYERWTLKGMLDLDNELKVAEEFWDFLGGKGTYLELLNCFERVGIELRSEIDEYFSRFK
jgi:type II restriction enzyme